MKKTGFNGGFHCSVSNDEMTCSLVCPEGIDFEYKPAAKYTCKFETGNFTPAPVPKCVIPEGVEILQQI